MKRLKGVNRYEAPVNATPGWTKSGDTWTYAFRGMNATTAAGIAINYTVAETPVENYETVVDGYDITNTLIPREPERTDILVGSKTWIDGDETPAWPYAFAGLGALALIALAILKKKRRA